MHYYQHNIGDYRRDTAHLSLLEHGVYRQLMDQYYLNENPLPTDLKKLHRLMSVNTDIEIDAVKNVLEDFFIKHEDGYIHKRCEDIIKEYHSKSDKARESANKRWEGKSNANAMRTHSEGNANHKPITINHKPITKVKYSKKDFELFWQNYPIKNGKGKAEDAWKKHKPNIDDVLKTLNWQKNTKQWFDKKFVPFPATYINQKRWLDEPTEEVTF